MISKRERQSKAQKSAAEVVQQLKTMNQAIEKEGGPRLPEKEYEALQKVLARKLVRA
jgi:hypothetical protein